MCQTPKVSYFWPHMHSKSQTCSLDPCRKPHTQKPLTYSVLCYQCPVLSMYHFWQGSLLKKFHAPKMPYLESYMHQKIHAPKVWWFKSHMNLASCVCKVSYTHCSMPQLSQCTPLHWTLSDWPCVLHRTSAAWGFRIECNEIYLHNKNSQIYISTKTLL